MTFRIIRWDGLLETPWKNGGGVAVDIAMSPETGAGEAFDWRVNVAKIARSGPFSDYPGIDRDFRVLDGGPVDLAVHGRPNRRLHAGGPEYRFPGDVPTLAELVAGPCRAFNVLTRRGRYTAHVRVIDVDRTAIIPAVGSTVVGFIVTGGVEVEGDSASVRLGSFDAFVASSRVSISGPAGGRAIVTDLTPVAP